MTVQLTVELPDGLHEWLAAAAERDFRTPAGQALCLIAAAQARESHLPGRAGVPDAQAVSALAGQLSQLHAQAGRPSTRKIAELTRHAGGQISHTTVHELLAGTRFPTWPALSNVVKALNGDEEHFRALWLAAL
jgi:hypothetical protein